MIKKTRVDNGKRVREDCNNTATKHCKHNFYTCSKHAHGC